MRLLFKLLTIIVVGAYGMIALSGVAERKVIYPFDPARQSPAEAGLDGVVEQRLERDGETLIVWTAAPRPGQPVILYFHGNAGNLAARAGRFRRFLARGYGLVAPAYRGSSGSSGTPVEPALIGDAVALWPLLTRMDAPVIVYGESLGAALGIALVARAPQRFSALVLEAPFTSIAELAGYHYPGTKEIALSLDNQWPSLRRAAALTLPLLVMHGTKDDLIPYEMGQRILAAAPSGEKKFLGVKGAGHTDLWRSDTLPRLWRFVDQFALR